MDFSYILAFGLSIVLFITFLFAYLQNYTARVMVNNYGEAHIEFILLSFVIIPFLFYGLYIRLKEVKKYGKQKEKV